MTAYFPLDRRLRLGHLILATFLTLLVPAPRAAGAELQRPTAHELAAIAAEGQRLWFHEEEFHRDPLLRARPHQVVVLHLEPGGKGGKPVRNTIPYLFAETADYTFCIPDDDPYIRSLRLTREGSSAPVVHVPRSGNCKTRTIAAGLYQLHIDHDGGAIAAEGKKAFVHVPRVKGAVLTENTGNPRATAGALATSTTSSLPACDSANPFNNALLMLATNGQFISDEGVKVSTQPTPPDALGGWYICSDGSGNYTIFQTGGPFSFSASGPPSTDTNIYVNYPPTPFKLTDLGNNQFTLAANFSGALYPIVLGADNVLHWATPGTPPAVFTIALKYYPLTVAAQPLQPGEAALFQACNYGISSTGTWVFTTTVPDFGQFRAFGVPFDNTIASVKLGPQTVATLYANSNFGGTAQVVGHDIPCLSSVPLGVNTTSSLKITPARQFVASTDECQNCNLSGVDLSNLDLSGGQFQGSTFTGANLANTSLQSASLDNANLNSLNSAALAGTSFVAALLHCTNFSGADLSQATVLFSGIRPVVTTDFSCRVDLTGATFSLNSFPLTQWRYFNLTGAKINGITGATLSTTASPLDLSGAILNQAVLPQVHLDGANLGCASTASGAVCTQLIETSLTSASLRRVTLEHALLQGANLNSTNLDGANLCAAKLNEPPPSYTQVSATLQGAFLRNVNLAQADLTGTDLTNANFYSTATVSTCNSAAACGLLTNCASAVNAALNNAVFTGAYLAGVDFSGSTPQSVDFSSAYLVGSNFTGTNLSQDSTSGKRTNFTRAWLQGTKFATLKSVTGANFTGAVVDLTHSHGATLVAQLSPATHLTFPSYTPSGTPGCVQFTYSSATVVPTTDNSNECPDSNFGPCSTAQWQTIPQPVPPSCTPDFNWIFVTY